jgi:hypothetical protein
MIAETITKTFMSDLPWTSAETFARPYSMFDNEKMRLQTEFYV